jgi:hypothetical protein
MFLDGGMRLTVLNVATGKLVSDLTLNDKVPETGKNLQTLMAKKSVPVANPDLLSSDGKYIYMAGQRFDAYGQRLDLGPAVNKESDQGGEGRHLFCPTGFLDASWYHRSYWIYGKNAGEGHGEYFIPRAHTPTGRIMVFDQSRVYASFALNVGNNLHPAPAYVLYAAGKDSFAPPKAAQKPTGKRGPETNWVDAATELRPISPLWITEQPPLLANAMVLAGKNLFIAGPPHVADERHTDEYVFGAETAIGRQLVRQESAWRGKEGGLLAVVSSEDGKSLGQLKLAALPIWDGMIAADGQLFISNMDGTLVCLGPEKQ